MDKRKILISGKKDNKCPICNTETNFSRNRGRFIARECPKCGLKIKEINRRLTVFKDNDDRDWLINEEGSQGCIYCNLKSKWKSEHIEIKKGIGYFKTQCSSCNTETREYYVYGWIIDLFSLESFGKAKYLTQEKKNKLVGNHVFWLNRIIGMLNDININYDFLE